MTRPLPQLSGTIIKLRGSVWLLLKSCVKILTMKVVWIGIMGACIIGWVFPLVEGMNRYDKYCLNLGSIILWVICAAVIGLGYYAFRRASKIGKIDDMP